MEHWWNDTDSEKRVPVPFFFTKNLIWTGTASGLGLCDESPAPSHGLIETLD